MKNIKFRNILFYAIRAPFLSFIYDFGFKGLLLPEFRVCVPTQPVIANLHTFLFVVVI